ncbi:hypothetical protein A9264_08905 [Vibrio sp. UCD-FRSSP16_10]|nr:hypothetical protein A9260_06005 [Vibrio sp. UCD-FRSSP16_30]OBT22144.1 hypothetical protein A9264_08905 [Vibrio sp. UCD-FRSSP16_10]
MKLSDFPNGLLGGLDLKNHKVYFEDHQFRFALCFGVALYLLWFFGFLANIQSDIHSHSQSYVLSHLLVLIILSPVIEEYVFRGMLQGRLLALRWGMQYLCSQRAYKISYANLITSLIFVAFHFINQSPLWALSVFIPSLILGHFRERYGSISPAIVLHVFYNALFFIFPLFEARLS